MLSLQGAEWGGGWTDGAAIQKNQSQTIIISGNGDVSQPQQKDRNKKEMSEIQLY